MRFFSSLPWCIALVWAGCSSPVNTEGVYPVDASTDGSTLRDAAHDTLRDAGHDTGHDAGHDAGHPVGHDAGTDVGTVTDTGVPDVMGMDAGPCTNVCTCADMGPPDFTGEGTGSPSASSDASQRAALVRANHWRTAMGLPPINANANLERSASAHSNFMANNPSSCWPGEHYEQSSCAGYTGYSPFDRMTAAGYSWSAASETIDQDPTPESAIDDWIWSVYHRMPFTQIVYPDTGFAAVAGGGSTYNTEDFAAPLSGGMATQSGVLVFPPPGTTGVPAQFEGDLEGPTPPAPMSTGAWPSGPVVSLNFPDMNFTVTDHQLYDGSCNPVVHSYFDATTDTNTQMLYPEFAYLYADVPLHPGETYTAEITATVDGAAYHRAWRFTIAE